MANCHFGFAHVPVAVLLVGCIVLHFRHDVRRREVGHCREKVVVLPEPEFRLPFAAKVAIVHRD